MGGKVGFSGEGLSLLWLSTQLGSRWKGNAEGRPLPHPGAGAGTSCPWQQNSRTHTSPWPLGFWGLCLTVTLMVSLTLRALDLDWALLLTSQVPAGRCPVMGFSASRNVGTPSIKFLPICLCMYVCIYLSIYHLSIYLPIYPSITHLSSIIYQSLSSIYQSSIYLSSIDLSFYHLSIIYLSSFLCLWITLICISTYATYILNPESAQWCLFCTFSHHFPLSSFQREDLSWFRYLLTFHSFIFSQHLYVSVCSCIFSWFKILFVYLRSGSCYVPQAGFELLMLLPWYHHALLFSWIFYLLIYFLLYWGLNSGSTPWATSPALFCEGFFWDRVS
jgi:hypothetical protein